MVNKEVELAHQDYLTAVRRNPDTVRVFAPAPEVFSLEHLENYARGLASSLKVSGSAVVGRRQPYDDAALTLDLRASYRKLSETMRSKATTTPASEWLVDNFHIVEEQLRDIRLHLPPKYYRGLPKISAGPFKGFPRVYVLGLAYLARVDNHLDIHVLKRFVAAFQTVTPLSTGELWAVAISLRIMLLETLSALAIRVVSSEEERRKADSLADAILELDSSKKIESDVLLAQIDAELGPKDDFSRAYIVQLTKRLRDQDPEVMKVRDWIEERLHRSNTSIEKLIELDLRREAAAQVTVGNIITSMRLISSIEWREFFEEVSLVEARLTRDPAGVYAHMEFQTRDVYRHAVERVARQSRRDELEVAEAAITWATAARDRKDENTQSHHVGFYLIGYGRYGFEKQMHCRLTLEGRFFRFLRRNPTSCYLSFALAVSLFFVSGLLNYFIESGGAWPLAIPLGILFLIPISELVLGLMNHYITVWMRPAHLSKLETKDGVPAFARTFVVIPALIHNVDAVAELFSSLEIHHLANNDPQIGFAVLGDFLDSATETDFNDDLILSAARTAVATLNDKYPGKFHFFHRRRLWNETQGKWMGWERKRGKLEEFNRLLRGDLTTSYAYCSRDPKELRDVNYILTLDADTRLPRDTARRLIGAISHPLNRPWINPKTRRVEKGFGIIQPRVSVDLSSSTNSRFAEVFSGVSGIDPYTTAVSDVYQDLFDEAVFSGKGIYDIDAFSTALHDRVPENALLSHDLFEGSFARAALASDLEVFDEFPADFRVYSKRLHRWIRGDWQILGWLFPRVRSSNRHLTPNDLSWASRWKIFDNLRRSFVPTATLIWLFLGWTVLPGAALIWSAAILLCILMPIWASVSDGVLVPPKNVSWSGHFRNFRDQSVMKVVQLTLMVTLLPELARIQLDAIFRTLYRLSISKRNLLEWTTFRQDQTANQKVTPRWLSAGPVVAIVTLVSVLILHLAALKIALAFVLVWLASPVVELMLARPISKSIRPLGPAEQLEVRTYARRTWHYFETFATAECHYLAPDNFQNDPNPVVAYRTSPTNLGLQLLATLAAHDFGFIGQVELIEKCEQIFAAMAKLPRFRGHFFNWYDIKELKSLQPEYVSSVDSGNLAGHLITFERGLAEAETTQQQHLTHRFAGLRDTLFALALEITAAKLVNPPSAAETVESVAALLVEMNSAITALIEQPFVAGPEAATALTGLKVQATEAQDILSALNPKGTSPYSEPVDRWILLALRHVDSMLTEVTSERPTDLTLRIQSLRRQSLAIIEEIDFSFLYNRQRKIFAIGYNVADSRLDDSYYDLLASESRLLSFVAIAKGTVPQEHWFRLGRQLTNAGGERALVSWTATMFEYLMPLLVMKNYPATLFAETYRAVVRRQREYGKERSVPWGISEAGYNARDLNFNYQYGPFGVPGLGLKRGLADDLVISPYSSALASMVDPHAALDNLRELQNLGAFGSFGFHESIDYTADRLPPQQKSFLLHSYMAHHQGMSLLAYGNLLHDNCMQTRFHSAPIVKATELLLQEKAPRQTELAHPRAEEVSFGRSGSLSATHGLRVYHTVDTPTPRTQILSNGKYSVLLSAAGSGFSKVGAISVNRWREDPTRDQFGSFIYIRSSGSKKVWSVAHQPIGVMPAGYECIFSEAKVEYRRVDGNIRTHTEIIVSPEDDVELRQVSIFNAGSETVELEVTSYLEVVMTRQQDDAAHPAFSNLFIQTEFDAGTGALIASRRPRWSQDNPLLGFHVSSVDHHGSDRIQYETDRARFLTRGRGPAGPSVIFEDRPLSNTVGPVLDPIFSLRRTVTVKPGQTARVCFATGVAPDRNRARELADKYRGQHIFQRDAELSWTRSRIQLRHLNIGADEAHIFQKLAGRIVYGDPALRPSSKVLSQNKRGQSDLWSYGVSGDLPIVLAQASSEKDLDLFKQLLRGHEYLRTKGLEFDLVVMNEKSSGYFMPLQEEILRQVRIAGSAALINKPGGIFLLRGEMMLPEEVLLFKSVARVVLSAAAGSLDTQLARKSSTKELAAPPRTFRRPALVAGPDPELPPDLKFFNGLGGFDSKHSEYVIHLKEGVSTPAPWINVISNESGFGFIASESGASYTWSENSRENRLTPWFNDPVTDPSGEMIYIRDDETGMYWNPAPGAARGPGAYQIRHGFGQTTYAYNGQGIEQQLEMLVAPNDDVKILRLRLKNRSEHARKLTVCAYVEWVLGFQRNAYSTQITTDYQADLSAVTAINAYNKEFAERTAFLTCSLDATSYTASRADFLGRNRGPANPLALGSADLSEFSGAGVDPCGALFVSIELPAGAEREVNFFLGQGNNQAKALELVKKYRASGIVKQLVADSQARWQLATQTLQVKTPDEATNLLLNGWLVYQTLACRVWGRSAFYQSGGAYGFRDQLQDVMALGYVRPDLCREQLVRAAGRQFPEGDVQHWWHPPSGRGVRTRFSDDLLWLPFVASYYLNLTGDNSLLDESVPFIDAPVLTEGHDDAYTQPTTSKVAVSVYEHCVRAIDRSLKVGEHGLPLMGSGDWNDGMSHVGNKGRGESVWVGWFLHSVIQDFLPYCRARGDEARVAIYEKHLANLKTALEDQGWDGAWYRRAYFDDGTPLGSALNDECRIDSISQSWAVLSGVADPNRARRAMSAVDEFLIDRSDGLIKLFTPPFDKGTLNPGYIKGYLPGVRENGGQYTHAAIWTLMAFAKLRRGDTAFELFSLINPINHAANRAGVHKYKVEPYVAVADIYGMHPHTGRGGWTWYTGSASWMYRAGIESILGLSIRKDRLTLNPAIPSGWPGFSLTLKWKNSVYEIECVRADAKPNATLAHEISQVRCGEWLDLVGDEKTHRVQFLFADPNLVTED